MMKNKTIHTEQGHWLLAKMGKKVLRPGGKKLSLKLVKELDISPKDIVVEFAPGMGLTAALLLAENPAYYVGVELNEEAASRLAHKIGGQCAVLNTTAAKTGLDSESVDKVLGEAMLTMQADHRKTEIMREARRILRPGGLYRIHELGLMPDDIDIESKKDIQRNLAKLMHVNARP